MLYEFISALASLPPVITASLVAAIVASIGGLLTQFFGWRSLKAQLTHEREKDREERDQASKREIYFEAASYLSQRLQSIMNMLNFNAEIEQPELALGTGNKIQLFASLETIQAASMLEKRLNELQIKVLAKRILFQQRQAALRDLEGEIASLRMQQQQLLALIEQPRLSRQAVQHLPSQIARLAEKLQVRISERARFRDSFAREVLQALQIVMDEMLTINERFPDLILAIRRELKQPIDEQAFGELMRHLEGETKQTLDKFLYVMDQQLQGYLKNA